mmetsp:Transcript_34431/g.106932  ORF Transcript_34431/g.106932 Transcript_34431/m.106932 type:complete len:368 (-) Transcript_34431:56-1159(-)
MALRGEEGWRAHHAEHFGEGRWEALHHALHRDVEHLFFVNPFMDAERRRALEREYSLEPTTIPGAYSFDMPPEHIPSTQYTAIERGDEHVIFVAPAHGDRLENGIPRGPPMPFFFADGASLIAALALRAGDCDTVLDVCAAPGAKALALASCMFAARFKGDAFPDVRGRLVCNEVSKERASKLQRTMRDFLPASLFDAGGPFGPHVVFTTADAGTPSNTMERSGPYDKILLDAPCTADRELLRGSGKLASWSQGTVRVSSERLLKWLHNALWLLREGGVLLFCTTALSHDECDGVVERLVRKASANFSLELLPLEDYVCRMVPSVAAEPTPWGTRILPDQTPFGPLYFSRLRLVKRTHEAVMHVTGA